MVSGCIARKKHSWRSRQKGQGIAELVSALICIIPVVLIVIDCGMLAVAAGLNDSVCREAARAAASGPPGESTVAENRSVGVGKEPVERALSVIRRIYITNLPMKIRETITTLESVRGVPPVGVGGAIDGEVSVQTVIDIYPPFLVGAVIGRSGIALKSKHTVPFTYVVPGP